MESILAREAFHSVFLTMTLLKIGGTNLKNVFIGEDCEGFFLYNLLPDIRHLVSVNFTFLACYPPTRIDRPIAYVGPLFV